MAETETPTGTLKDRQELSSMGFLDHLEELRRRIIRSFLYVAVGFCVCFAFHEKLFTWMKNPIIYALQSHHQQVNLVYTNPTDPFNLSLKISLIAGLFIASPFVLYQIWGFIAPGLYRNERRYVAPFMVSTVGLFTAGGYFAYRIVYPAALEFLINYSAQFTPMITIQEYMSLFLTLVLGLGIVFEMPILVFFLALFGIVSPGWMIRNFRYSVLGIFIIAGALAPTPDIMNMLVFAAPMLGLYVISIGVAWLVHPKNRKKRQEKKAEASAAE